MPADPGRAQRLAPPLAVGALAAVATVALHLRDPHRQGSWGICPTQLLGLDCPFCGSLRAVHHLTDVDLAAAASSNLLLVVALPFVLVLWGRRLHLAWRGGPDWRTPIRLPAPAWWVLLGLVVVFTIARNLPGGAWLAS